MKKDSRMNDEMRDHYDFSGGVRGKYASRYAEGTNVVVLDPDVAQLFPNREAVNETLRAVAQIVQIQERRRGRANKAVSREPRRARGRSRLGRGR
jgi:hypothetical protein